MATNGTSMKRAKAKRDRFDLDGALRKLGRRLFANDGTPRGFSVSALQEGGRIGSDEHSFLFWLAVGHLYRHDKSDPAAHGGRPCSNGDGPCQIAGLAHALLRGCDALRDRKYIRHVEELRDDLSKADRALTKLTGGIDEYLKSCHLLHETDWKELSERSQQYDSRVRVHIHEDVCLLPSRLSNVARAMRRALAMVDAISLVPQYASRAVAAANSPGQQWRPLLLAEMQADLVYD